MAAPRQFPFKSVLLLTLVPAAWWLLDYSAALAV